MQAKMSRIPYDEEETYKMFTEGKVKVPTFGKNKKDKLLKRNKNINRNLKRYSSDLPYDEEE